MVDKDKATRCEECKGKEHCNFQNVTHETWAVALSHGICQKHFNLRMEELAYKGNQLLTVRERV